MTKKERRSCHWKLTAALRVTMARDHDRAIRARGHDVKALLEAVNAVSYEGIDY